jgi:large subunit ribosomal protein L4
MPQHRGGGVIHAPKPRDYSQRTPKKMIVAALRGALSDRARNGRVHVIDQFALGEQPSTKAAASFLAQVATSKNILVVLDRSDELSYKSLRNLTTVHVLAVDQLNAYDVLHSDDIVFTASALTQFVAAAAGTEEVSE